jgi:hypothetical protein
MADPFGINTVGSPVQPCPPRESREVYWIEIELVGEDGEPIPWQEYRLIASTGERIKGFLNDKGWARIENLKQGGEYRIGFPVLDKDAWQFIESVAAKES